METQTRFDLNAAIENWRRELAAQLDLSPEVRRELETHLRDSVAELQRRGLNDEESFWLARRRTGQPIQLCEEFAKADPVRVWRERLLWVAVGVLGLQVWTGIASLAMGLLQNYLLKHNPMFPDWVTFYLPFLRINWANLMHSEIFITLLWYAPVVCLAILFARGRLSWVVAGLKFMFRSRRRFLVFAVSGFAVYVSWLVFVILFFMDKGASSIKGNPSIAYVAQGEFAEALWHGALVALIAWLLPTKDHSSLKQE